ncbi:MAG: hypothetical protein OXR66_01460 [Candidatus Woesearchaeota archaeon]|nr:hypothetical protein [Candidatus Woesearchaeota archaeon]
MSRHRSAIVVSSRDGMVTQARHWYAQLYLESRRDCELWLTPYRFSPSSNTVEAHRDIETEAGHKDQYGHKSAVFLAFRKLAPQVFR